MQGWTAGCRAVPAGTFEGARKETSQDSSTGGKHFLVEHGARGTKRAEREEIGKWDIERIFPPQRRSTKAGS